MWGRPRCHAGRLASGIIVPYEAFAKIPSSEVGTPYCWMPCPLPCERLPGPSPQRFPAIMKSDPPTSATGLMAQNSAWRSDARRKQPPKKACEAGLRVRGVVRGRIAQTLSVRPEIGQGYSLERTNA